MKGTKRTVVYLISLLIILGFWMIPAPAGMSASGMQVLGILLGVLLGLSWLVYVIAVRSYSGMVTESVLTIITAASLLKKESRKP